jgi:hypothetical protein
MRVYCSVGTVLRFAFWTVLVGIFLGVLLTHHGTPAPVSTVGYQQVERGCFSNANS